MAILVMPSVFMYLAGLFSNPLFSPEETGYLHDTCNMVGKCSRLRGCGKRDKGKMQARTATQGADAFPACVPGTSRRAAQGPARAPMTTSQIHGHVYESHKHGPTHQEKQTWTAGEKETSPKVTSGENCSLILSLW